MTPQEFNRLLSYRYASSHRNKPTKAITTRRQSKSMSKSSRSKGRSLIDNERVFNHPTWQSWPTKQLKF